MNRSHIRRKVLGLAVLIGAAFLTVYPVRAQEDPPSGTGPVPVPPSPAGSGAGKLKVTPFVHKSVNTIRTGVRFVDSAGQPVLLDYDTDGIFTDATVAWKDLLVARVIDQADEMLGATLQPVGPALRAQLDLPDGQGLLVASLRGEGPSAQAGLKQNDVLLTLADKPLAVADDLAKQLKAAGESAVPLKVFRAGKPVVLQVRPVYRVTLGPAAERKTEYYIGVSIDAPDDALRAQLALPTGQGVLISDVLAGSPAEKSGVKKYDIVLEMAGKPIDSPETLARQVQAMQDKPTTLKVLRAGKPITIPVTGTVRKAEAGPPEEALRLWLVDQQTLTAREASANQLLDSYRPLSARTGTADVRLRLDQLEKELHAVRRLEAVEKELKALHQAVEKINDSLKTGAGKKPD